MKLLIIHNKYQSNKIVADFELCYTLYQQNKTFKNVDTVVASYSAGGLSDTRKIDIIVGWWNVIKKDDIKNLYYVMNILKEIFKLWIKKCSNINRKYI